MPKVFRDEQLEKIQSRLRVFANGKSRVNAIRAEHVGGLRVASQEGLTSLQVDELRDEDSKPRELRDVQARDRRRLRRGTMGRPPDDIEANVFITMRDPEAAYQPPGETARRSRYRTAEIRLSDLEALSKNPDVAYVELGESIRSPRPLDGSLETSLPARLGRNIGLPQVHKDGAGILVGVIDVQGFDFAHPDFMRNGRTRFVALWDQGATPRNGVVPRINDEHVPPSFRYGNHLDRGELQSAIRIARDVGVTPSDVEPQSQQVVSSHGTHVASIASGNNGVCPKAWIAGVSVSLAPEESDRRLSFYDSTRLAHAVDYLLWAGDAVGAKAVSINISLGTNGGAHDGSEALSRWIDSALSTPGRAVTVAAGNAGQENPAHENDLGFLTGRIHTEGHIDAAALTHDIDWVVVGNSIVDISENELEIWYSAQDRFAVQVRPPESSTWMRVIEPGEYIENEVRPDKTVVSIYNELYHHANGENKISVFLSPFMHRDGVVGVKAGRWTVRLIGRDVRNGSFHGWIERDDPRPLRRQADQDLWRFPSFFPRGTNVDRSSISSLACGPNVIGVANLDASNDRINRTSSQGPTRDGRTKPDVAAPGTDILAANAFFPEAPWIHKTGTSMASPYVAGVIGLMLATNPNLSAGQIRGIIHRTARPLPGATYEWTDDAGYGVIDPEACIREAHHARTRKDRTRKAKSK